MKKKLPSELERWLEQLRASSSFFQTMSSLEQMFFKISENDFDEKKFDPNAEEAKVEEDSKSEIDPVLNRVAISELEQETSLTTIELSLVERDVAAHSCLYEQLSTETDAPVSEFTISQILQNNGFLEKKYPKEFLNALVPFYNCGNPLRTCEQVGLRRKLNKQMKEKIALLYEKRFVKAKQICDLFALRKRGIRRSMEAKALFPMRLFPRLQSHLAVGFRIKIERPLARPSNLVFKAHWKKASSDLYRVRIKALGTSSEGDNTYWLAYGDGDIDKAAPEHFLKTLNGRNLTKPKPQFINALVYDIKREAVLPVAQVETFDGGREWISLNSKRLGALRIENNFASFNDNTQHMHEGRMKRFGAVRQAAETDSDEGF